MADGVSADNSELDKLVADLGKVPDKSGENMVKAIKVGAGNVKKGWRQRLEGADHLPQAARSITYDVKGSASAARSEISAEIGPELGGQGSIVGLVELGTANSPARGYGLAALQEEEADFEKGLNLAIDSALDGLGL
jgi:hypothetical protein